VTLFTNSTEIQTASTGISHTEVAAAKRVVMIAVNSAATTDHPSEPANWKGHAAGNPSSLDHPCGQRPL